MDITKESGLGYIGHSSGVVFFNFNSDDGLLDLFLVNVGVYTSDQKGRGALGSRLSQTFNPTGRVHGDFFGAGW